MKHHRNMNGASSIILKKDLTFSIFLLLVLSLFVVAFGVLLHSWL